MMQMTLRVGNYGAHGFTIVEVLTVVAIIAILLTAAIAGYENFVSNNQASIIASRLADSLRLAQSQAVRTGLPITVCPISPEATDDSFVDSALDGYTCLDSTEWDAWKVFIDPNFAGVGDGGSLLIDFVGGHPVGAVVSNISGPIIFDTFGFANINPVESRSGWSWNSSMDSDWTWSYTYSSEYTGDYYRVFMVVPPGCTGNNARAVEVTQNGLIIINHVDCYGS